MDESLIDRERVDERLQRGARRALRGRAIDLPGDRVVRESGGADHRADPHIAGVDQQSGGVLHAQALLLTDIPLQDALDQVLLVEIQGRLDDGGVVEAAAQDEAGEVRGLEGQLPRAVVVERESYEARLVAGLRMARLPLCEKAAARGCQRGRLRGSQGRAGRGSLGDEYQGESLAERELPGILPEVDLARRTYSLDVAAVGQQVDVGLQEVVLRVTQ